jgi:hypothetical protein
MDKVHPICSVEVLEDYKLIRIYSDDFLEVTNIFVNDKMSASELMHKIAEAKRIKQ